MIGAVMSVEDCVFGYHFGWQFSATCAARK
jgi:hypothetical protein